MSLSICVLGSGSSGNATLMRLGETVILIDAGLGPRTVAKRLVGTGLDLGDIRAILLTHADRDHFSPTWARTILRQRLPIFFHERHRYAVCRSLDASGTAPGARQIHQAGLLQAFDGDQPFDLEIDSQAIARVHPVLLAHDANGTCGYRIDNHRASLGYATDLGRVPAHMLKAFVDVDILAIESNYDPQMELASARPAMLKKRIMGGRGHLSNVEALNAVRSIVGSSRRRPHHIVLLHLSRQCNAPAIIRRLYASHEELVERLCLTSQYRRTDWLHVDSMPAPLPGEQLAMFG